MSGQPMRKPKKPNGFDQDFNQSHGGEPKDPNKDLNVGQLLSDKWPRVETKLHAELGEDLFTSWFKSMEAEDIVGETLVVSVPTPFLRKWIESHYASALTRICQSEFASISDVRVVVRNRGLPTQPSHLAPSPQPDQGGAANNLSGDPADHKTPADQASDTSNVVAFSGYGSPLDASLTFDNFIAGPSNALAHAAALRVCQTAGSDPLSFNPLYIHSAAGFGKTHLLNAISAKIRQEHPESKVLYITAERFMYHFVAALKAKDMLSFKDFFQNIDVLLIDDFQFLQGKVMQQEFCHTFTSLVDAKRQVIVAADVPPTQLGSIDQRMRSRFVGGLVVDIAAPDLELRRKILLSRLATAQQKDPTLLVGEDVVEFIANRITAGGRELEGALNRVIASQQLTRTRATIDLAAIALRDMAQQGEPLRIRIEDILRIVGHHYDVTRNDLLSTRRTRAIVRPRQIGMYLAKKLTPRSLPEIGRRFGGKDHSTVLHAVRKIENLMKDDDKLAREISVLSKLIEQR